jgi:bcr-type benzoyl-CoA reductase subunit C
MSKVEEILSELGYVAHHPARMVEQWKKETGGKAVGIMPIHCAEEVVHAAGMLPVGMWGGQTSISLAPEYLQSFCCSIMKAVMEFTMSGAYKDLDAIICPETCDTLRVIPLMMRKAVPQIPIIGIVLPDNRKIDAGIKYTAAEYRSIVKQLEQITGKPVKDEDLQNSIEIYNEHHAAMMEFFKVAVDHCDIITPYNRHMVIKSSYFIPKEKHTVLVRALIDELNKLEPTQYKGHKVVVTGIMSEPDELLEMFENYGYAIVADDLAQGSRQFRTPAPPDDDPYIRLGKRLADFEGCAVVYDPEKLRGKLLKQLVDETQADGVVVLMMKFCDPEEYDYPFIKKDLDEAGIPHLYLEIEQQMESSEQVQTRLQAFAELLEERKN